MLAEHMHSVSVSVVNVHRRAKVRLLSVSLGGGLVGDRGRN